MTLRCCEKTIDFKIRRDLCEMGESVEADCRTKMLEISKAIKKVKERSLKACISGDNEQVAQKYC